MVFRFHLFLPTSVCLFSNVLVFNGRTVGSDKKIFKGPPLPVGSEDKFLAPVGSEDKLSERLLPVMQCVTVKLL